jgi:hypothetical protein
MSCGCRLLPTFWRDVLPPSSGQGKNTFRIRVCDVRKAGFVMEILARKWEKVGGGGLQGGCY